MTSSFFVRVNNIFNFINFLICVEFNLTKFNVNKKNLFLYLFYLTRYF